MAEKDAECLGVFLCLLTARLRDPSAVVPLAAELVRRRDQNRLDETAAAPALDLALARLCGAPAPAAVDVADPAVAVAEVEAQARRVSDFAALARDHVTPGWMRRFNERVGRGAQIYADLCAQASAGAARALAGTTAPFDETIARHALGGAVFLASTASAAIALRFDAARLRALADIRAVVHETHRELIDERLLAVVQRSSGDVGAVIRQLTELVSLLDGARAAADWARRARRIVGRPSFPEQVLSLIDPITVEDGQRPIRRGQVSRALSERLWDWAAAQPGLAAGARAAELYDEQRGVSAVKAHAIADKFRDLLSKTVQDALDDGGLKRDLDASDPEVAQLSTIAALLACDQPIRTTLEQWPARIKHVEEAHVAGLRALHDEISFNRPDVEPALLLVVMARLDRPWHILRILERIAKTRKCTLVEASEFVAVGEVLLDDAEADAALFAAAERDGFRADPVIAALERFAGVASGMTEEFEIRKDGVWGRRLYALKARAARDLESACDAAVRAVEAVTPRRAVGGARWTPDLSRSVEDAAVGDAVQRARFLGQSKILDHRAAFAGARSRAISLIDGRLDGQAQALLEIAHAGAERETALAQLRPLADIVRELHGEEAGQILRRRMAAA